MQHDLEKLGPIGFQDLAAALALAVCGHHVQILGSGRDGGRDMFCNGTIIWSAQHNGAGGEVWDGYTVFQVKHKERLANIPADNATWLWRQVRTELDKWADGKSGRDRVPDYLVIVSNVPLTPTPESGGLAQLNQSIVNYIRDMNDDSRDVDDASTNRREERKRRMARLKAWRIWDGNQIDGLISVHSGIRRGFGAFLTAADVFSHLADFTDKLPLDQLESGLRRHARTALMGERSIYFDEAGSADGSGTPIEQVAIDLPIASPPDQPRRTVFGHVLDRGERVLRPRLGTITGPKHIVIAGGPGNGKTTMSRFLVQAYRAGLLADGLGLGDDHRHVVDATRVALRSVGRAGLPRHRRWPMRIDLGEYVEEEGLKEDSTLLRWIAHKVSKRSNAGVVSPGALDSWMKQWPWFLVLDGLDEVTEPRVRKRLITQITELVTDAEGDNCDLLVVVTTRPTGYVENIAPTQFERIDMSRLHVDEAVKYGIQTTRVRLKDDLDKVERVEVQLRRAAETDSLRNLMQTPLQVLIMTIIVEGSGRLAPDRYSLFWGYYDAVLKRERSKPTPYARLLQEHAPHVLELHQRVAFELQLRSEESDGSTATMKPDELRLQAWHVLHEVGFKPSDSDSALLDSIVTAATHRLVLLAPRGDEGLGFDVRSLQELMAARFLTTGTLTETATRLTLAAASPHWRNTWVFAAGRIFAEPQTHQYEVIVDLVERVDQDAAERLGRVGPVGPLLALDLIDDGMARSHPRFYDRLLRVAFEVLNTPRLPDPLAVARILLRSAAAGERPKQVVADALRDALSSANPARYTAQKVQELVGVAGNEAGLQSAARTLSAVRARSTTPSPSPSIEAAWDTYKAAIAELPDSDEVRRITNRADQAIQRLGNAGDVEAETNPVLDALSNYEAAQILEIALESLVHKKLDLLVQIRDGILPTVHRQPIGELLRLSTA